MQLGFSTVMYEDTDLAPFEIIRKAADLGYQGIELNLSEQPYEANIDGIKNALEKYGVEVAAIGTRHMYVTHGLYIAAPDAGIREKALNYVEECMKIAKTLRCPLVQAGWAFQGSKLETSKETTWKRAVEGLKRIGELGEKYGIKFVIEFACRDAVQLVITMDDALRMLDDVDSERVLVMADTYHIDAENYSPRQAVLKAGSRLGYIHIADNNRLTPGQGHIDFGGFISALKKIHYSGYLIMEFNPEPTQDEALKQALAHMKKFI